MLIVACVYVVSSRNGCKPFVEVYVGEERVLTTSQEYELMRLFFIILWRCDVTSSRFVRNIATFMHCYFAIIVTTQ